MTLSKLLVDIPNPFGDGIVGNPWHFDVKQTPDIESIHAPAFGTCLRLLMRDVRANGQSSLLIAGPAGSGKTHLVARLRRRLHVSDPPGLLCYVSLEDVAPQMLWAHLRERVATDLLIRPDAKGKTGLERLLEIRVPGLLAGAAPKQATDENIFIWISKVLSNSRRTQICTRLRQELFEKVRLDAEVRTALLKLFGDDLQQIQLARDWLIGERLTDEQLARLGLPQGDLSDQVREHQSRQVVLSLLKLADSALPIVVCFDQIEHLVQSLQDRSGFVRLGQMITKLRHEATKGLLVLCFVRTDLLSLFRDAVGAADWARIAENNMSLSPLTWNEANQLILQRMNSVPALQQLRQGQADEYWPLDKQRLQTIYNRLRLTCTPRELLWECKKVFTGPGGRTPEPTEYLLTKWQQKYQQKKILPAGDRLLHALNGVPWLASLLSAPYEKIELRDLQEALPDANVFLQKPDGERLAFSACPRTTQLWRRFDRLSRDWNRLSKRFNCRQLILACDTPLEQLPPGTKSRLQTLNQVAGVYSVCPAPEQMIGLDALHSLLTDAHMGELVYEGQALPAEDVDRWAREGLAAAGHELGMLRLLFDDLGLELPATTLSVKTSGQPILARNG
jgi:hypothetical protein